MESTSNGATANGRCAAELLDRAPPHDAAVERALLGSILLKPDCFDNVATIVAAADFHDTTHGQIFRAMESLRREGKPIDVKLLVPRLQAGNGSAGDSDATSADVARLIQETAFAANAVHYAERIADLAKRRRLLLLGGDLMRGAHGDRPPGEILDEAAGRLGTIRAGVSAKWEPVTMRLSDVKSRPVEWLWPGRIALGKLTLLVGDPGLGKSCLTLDLAARVSRGSAWPDDPEAAAPLGSVVLLGAEDALSDTVRPRLEAMGADASRIVALEGVKAADEAQARTVNLDRDVAAVEKAICASGDCRLVVVDPISAYLGPTDSHKNADVRALLAPLCDLAERNGVAIVAVTHLNKGSGTAAMYRATGSLAFVAAARAAWLVTSDPADATRRLLLPMKNNLAGGTSGMAFRIGDGGVVGWEPDPVPIGADAALAALARGAEPDGTAEWLRGALAAGPVPVKRLFEDAEAEGITRKQLQNAKNRIGAESLRVGFGPGSICEWCLPDQQRAPIDSHTSPYIPVNGTGNLWESMDGRAGPNALGDAGPATEQPAATAAEGTDRYAAGPTRQAAGIADGCPRCRSKEWRDAPTHGGRSMRRDCRRCGYTIGFPVWYDVAEPTLAGEPAAGIPRGMKATAVAGGSDILASTAIIG